MLAAAANLRLRPSKCIRFLSGGRTRRMRGLQDCRDLIRNLVHDVRQGLPADPVRAWPRRIRRPPYYVWGKPLVNSGLNTSCGTLSVTGGFRRVRYCRPSGRWLIASRAVGPGLPDIRQFLARTRAAQQVTFAGPVPAPSWPNLATPRNGAIPVWRTEQADRMRYGGELRRIPPRHRLFRSPDEDVRPAAVT